MSESSRYVLAINGQRDWLVKNISLFKGPELLNHLVDKRILTNEAKATVKSYKTEDEAVTYLLDLLMKADDRRFADFIWALRSSGHEHVAEQLQKKLQDNKDNGQDRKATGQRRVVRRVVKPQFVAAFAVLVLALVASGYMYTKQSTTVVADTAKTVNDTAELFNQGVSTAFKGLVKEADKIGVFPASRVTEYVSNMSTTALTLVQKLSATMTDRDVMLAYYVQAIRPSVEQYSPFWNELNLPAIKALENVQRYFTKQLPGMEGLGYKQRLELLGLETLETRRIRADLLYAYKVWHGLKAKAKKEDYFVLAQEKASGGHQFKLLLPQRTHSVMITVYSSRVIRIWNDLPGDVVDFSSLAAFERSLSTDVLSKYALHKFE